MGINKPSLYAAYGNKEQLFRKVLDRYRSGPIGFLRAALDEPRARLVAARLLGGMVELLGNPDHPGGCLVVQAALTSGADSDPIRRELAAARPDAFRPDLAASLNNLAIHFLFELPAPSFALDTEMAV